MPKISFKNDIDCKTKEIKGEGLGKLPTDVERLIEKNRDKVISKITIFRLPLADELVKMLNLLTNDSVKKFLKKDDQHDRLFHLGMFLRQHGKILCMTNNRICHLLKHLNHS
jgi:hypothetical protein